MKDANDLLREHGPDGLRLAFDGGHRNGSATRRGAGEPLPLRYWNDLDTVTAPDKLIRRLLGTTSLTLVVGEPGCGKSFLVTDAGLHIALGEPWFGRAVTCGAVLYVAAEGHGGLGNRIRAFRDRHDTPADVPFVVVPAAPNLGPDGKDTDAVIAAANAVERRTGKAVVLVVIDTLARTMGTGDENLAADMGRFIMACDRIRLEVGATVLIVHHRPKGQTGARGSSALPGACDTIIEVEKREGGRVAKVTKQKDGADGIEIGFELDVVEIGRDDDGEAITSCVVRPTEDVAKHNPMLSALEKRALSALHNLMVDQGQPAPKGVTFPNVTVVKLSLFRDALKSIGVTDRDKPDSERSQWRRITTNLSNKGVFRQIDDLCWSTVTQRDTP